MISKEVEDMLAGIDSIIEKVPGKKNGRPVGKRRKLVNSKGYTYTYVDGKLVTYQRVVMEDKLNRKLFEHETVVFIDKDKTNFNPENLAVGLKSGYSLQDIECPHCGLTYSSNL